MLALKSTGWCVGLLVVHYGPVIFTKFLKIALLHVVLYWQKVNKIV
jgi:hypothetical protein